jgi:tetratricopeptide (TPR) repeat protein
MYQRALNGYEKAWGPDHTLTLNTVNNLGLLYKTQGKLNEAEEMYQRALNGYEKALGPIQVITYVPAMNTFENLAVLFSQTGRVDSAKELYRRAQQGLGTAFGHSSKRCKNISIALADLSINNT